MTAVFTLSIELEDGRTVIAPAHLGTDPNVAIKVAEEYFRHRIFHGVGQPAVKARTVALMRNNKIWDVYDGDWASEREYDDSERAAEQNPYQSR